MNNKCDSCIWKDQCGDPTIENCDYYDSGTDENCENNYREDLNMREKEYRRLIKEQRK